MYRFFFILIKKRRKGKKKMFNFKHQLRLVVAKHHMNEKKEKNDFLWFFAHCREFFFLGKWKILFYNFWKKIDVSIKIFGSSCLQEYTEEYEEKEENFLSSSVRRHGGGGGCVKQKRISFIHFFLLKILIDFLL